MSVARVASSAPRSRSSRASGPNSDISSASSSCCGRRAMRVDLFDAHVGEAGGGQDLVDVVWLAERQRAGGAGRLRLRRPEPGHGDLSGDEPRIVLERPQLTNARCPPGRRRPPGWRRPRPDLEEHHAEARTTWSWQARSKRWVCASARPVGRWSGRQENTSARRREQRLRDVDPEHQPRAPTASASSSVVVAAPQPMSMTASPRDAAPFDQSPGQRHQALIERLREVTHSLPMPSSRTGLSAFARRSRPNPRPWAPGAPRRWGSRASQASRSARARRASAVALGLGDAPVGRREQPEVDVHRLKRRGIGAPW